MKHTNHIMAAALALLTAMPAAAQGDSTVTDYEYMNVLTADKNIKYERAMVRKITFGNGKVKVYSSEGIREFDQIDLRMLIFSNDMIVDDIRETDASPEGGVFRKGILGNLNVPDGTPVHVYSISGLLFSTAEVNQNAVNLSSLPKATYIVKVGKNAYKIQVE